jgi:hypothetical protein
MRLTTSPPRYTAQQRRSAAQTVPYQPPAPSAPSISPPPPSRRNSQPARASGTPTEASSASSSPPPNSVSDPWETGQEGRRGGRCCALSTLFWYVTAPRPLPLRLLPTVAYTLRGFRTRENRPSRRLIRNICGYSGLQRDCDHTNTAGMRAPRLCLNRTFKIPSPVLQAGQLSGQGAAVQMGDFFADGSNGGYLPGGDLKTRRRLPLIWFGLIGFDLV